MEAVWVLVLYLLAAWSTTAHSEVNIKDDQDNFLHHQLDGSKMVVMDNGDKTADAETAMVAQKKTVDDHSNALKPAVAPKKTASDVVVVANNVVAHNLGLGASNIVGPNVVVGANNVVAHNASLTANNIVSNNVLVSANNVVSNSLLAHAHNILTPTGDMPVVGPQHNGSKGPQSAKGNDSVSSIQSVTHETRS